MRKIFSLVIVFVVTVTIFSAAHAMEYQLEQVVVVSRHNLRNSLKAGDDRGLLTLRGGEMETLMGQYFEARLRAQGLFPKNAQPSVGEVRFYANSYQRTIATAKYFSRRVHSLSRTFRLNIIARWDKRTESFFRRPTPPLRKCLPLNLTAKN